MMLTFLHVWICIALLLIDSAQAQQKANVLTYTLH
jgi:hypothetical protein